MKVNYGGNVFSGSAEGVVGGPRNGASNIKVPQ